MALPREATPRNSPGSPVLSLSCRSASEWWRVAARAPPNGFVDAPRSGAPPTITPEQTCAIVALACERPDAGGVPLSQWSASDLAREAVRRGIVTSISPRSVGRFLKESDLKPHLVRPWLTPKPDPDFEAKCIDVCRVYRSAIEARETVRTV